MNNYDPNTKYDSSYCNIFTQQEISKTPTLNELPAVEATVKETCDVDNLNSLLRGELSAVETYEQAKSKFDEIPVIQSELDRIAKEHRDAVNILRTRVTQYGGEPSVNSGAWGTFATVVAGTAKIFGPETTLDTLKKGEEHGIKEYKRAIENDEVSLSCKVYFQKELIPRCEEHIHALERLATLA
jgi:hypothetical protein